LRSFERSAHPVFEVSEARFDERDPRPQSTDLRTATSVEVSEYADHPVAVGVLQRVADALAGASGNAILLQTPMMEQHGLARFTESNE
jgi:hypothetical protein